MLELKALPDGGGGKRIFFADVHDSWSVSQKKFELPIKNRKILLVFIFMGCTSSDKDCCGESVRLWGYVGFLG